MKKVEIKTRIANQLTGEVVTDSHIQTSYEDRKSFGAACERSHKAFSQDNADCCVNMSWRYEGEETWNFIYGTCLNQQRDELAVEEGKMTWGEYESKWYPKVGAHQFEDATEEEKYEELVWEYMNGEYPDDY